MCLWSGLEEWPNEEWEAASCALLSGGGSLGYLLHLAEEVAQLTAAARVA